MTANRQSKKYYTNLTTTCSSGLGFESSSRKFTKFLAISGSTVFPSSGSWLAKFSLFLGLKIFSFSSDDSAVGKQR